MTNAAGTPKCLTRIEAPLPRGTIQRKPSARKGHYDPNTRTIVLTGNSRREALHERGHYLWDRRMSKAARAAFTRSVQRLADAQWKSGGKRRRNLARARAGEKYPVVEEMWAVAYAAFKERRAWLPSDVKKAVQRVLKTAPRRGAT